MVFILSKWLLPVFVSLGFSGMITSEGAGEPALHPFYVSVTEVNHNAAEKSLEISCKFFADDFEQVLEKTFKTQLDLSADKNKALFDQYIAAYIARHLLFNIDGKPVKLNYVGFEKEKESVYCYFEIVQIPSVKRLDITNDLLYELTKEQINIMHITLNGKRQSAKQQYPEVKFAYSY